MKHTKNIFVLISLFTLIFTFTNAASATDWTVNPGGNIQSFIDNASDNDTITVNDNNGTAYTYTENLVINKKLNLKAKTGGNVTVQALNSSKSVFTINSGGSGSTIQGFIIKGTTQLFKYGIYLNGASNCNITENTITNNYNGILLENNANTTISKNTITNNQGDGILLDTTSNCNITENTITNNRYWGLLIQDSENTTISKNTITNHKGDGILLYTTSNCKITENTITNTQMGISVKCSNNITISRNNIINNSGGICSNYSSINIYFNRIFGNKINGLYISGNGNITAINNWWGTNNPNVSLIDDTSDICILNGTVTYDPWLVLNVNADPVDNNGTSTVTADLTRDNNGGDTSPLGHIPDNIPINFTANSGTITNICYTRNGKALSTFNLNENSGAVISSNLDQETLKISVIINGTIDSTNPTVEAIQKGGTYNKYISVNLTANDNYDPYPKIYYTLDGTNPTTSSTLYTIPINITNIIDITILKFMAADATGNLAQVQTENYVIMPPVTNINTNKTYFQIQEAINDSLTLNDHIIEVKSGTYAENIVINKKLTIRSVSGGNITIQSLNSYENVFTVNANGNGSTIQGFIIKGATSTGTYGIYLNGALNCNITENTITNNSNGINLQNSTNNTISKNTITNSREGINLQNGSNNNVIIGNTITNNSKGIYLQNSSNNTLSRNMISNNIEDGIYLYTSNNIEIIDNNLINNGNGIYLRYNSSNNTIFKNIISNNSGVGIFIYATSNNIEIIGNTVTNNSKGISIFSSSARINFNRITGNSGYGLYAIGSGNINATDNWWGTNNPINSYNSPSDIFILGGNVTYSPWLVLNVTASPNIVSNNGDSVVNVDLTRNNQGNDSSSQGNIPDGIPLNFTTNMGTVTGIVYTRNGKASATFNRGAVTSGIANITTTLDKQSVQTNVTIDTIAPTVTANLADGTYNTYQNVTLTASDNIDTNPVIYYTTDGTTPTTSSTRYTAPISIVKKITTLKFIAVDAAGNQAQVQTKNYTINLPITNINTGKVYSTIQNAANDSLTLNDHIIEIASGTYTENIVINKKLTIRPVSGGTVTIQALNPSQSVIMINSLGNSSIIQGLTVKGATNSSGIYLNGTSNCTITGNNVTNSKWGIDLSYANNNTIQNNTAKSNTFGVHLANSYNVIIKGNTLSNNQYGINPWSSSANIIFNIITESTSYGLVSEYSTTNATNNWWGSNNPVVSSNTPSDICITGGTVTYNPWLVLTVTSSSDNVAHESTTNVTADLTRNNQGGDTSSQGNIPDNIPINFTATLGTVTTPITTKNGKSTSIYTSSNTSGTATISATFDRQTVSKTLNIIGVYNNRTQTGYTTIQSAINDALNNDTILIQNGTYTENILINKTLTLKNQEGNTATIQALNTSQSVIMINSLGNSSIIQGLTIKGATATNSNGIYLNGASNCTITENTLTGNYNGINLNNANNNTIQNNTITGNSWIAIELNYSNNNKIKNNNIAINYYGIHLGYSHNETITENTITDSTYGINPQYSSATIRFNRIIWSSRYGLVNQLSSVIDATNNWWGTNNPINSANFGSQLCIDGGTTATYNPWFSADIGFTTNQVAAAAGTVKTYIETNHQLPSSVAISGISVSMPQFLKLATKTVLNINNDLNTVTILGNYGNTANPLENMTVGVIFDDEFINIANNINIFMDTNGNAPNYVSNTSLGSSMRFESLVYMYSQILNNYTSNQTLNDTTSVIPWLAVTNPNGTYNFRTQELFTSIQSAIDDADTQNDDIIYLGKGSFTENVIINKKLKIRPISGNVTVNALNPNLPVFTIGSGGSGSLIQNLIIKGATGNAGIYINITNNSTLTGNNITGNLNGIYLDNSTETDILGNIITNNSFDGVYINTGLNITVSDNTIKSNGHHGISINNSNKTVIDTNIISNNYLDGIYFYNSSAEVHFNKIALNSRYGLFNEGNGTVNATDNWWGTNSPLVSLNSTGDICILNGTVIHDTWLVLNINSTCDYSNRTGTCYNYEITADLNKNNQGNTVPKGNNIPDGIPINFNTTLGTINTSISTRNGKSTAKLTSTTAGNANVSVTLDNQTLAIPVTIKNVNVLGIYNNRTGERFTSIQAAINSTNTLNGDTITLGDGTYTENIIVSKQLTIKPDTGANVTIQAADSDTDEDVSVLTINKKGSGSTIEGLKIKGSDKSYGIDLNSANNCIIRGNTITDNDCGIYLYISNNNTIFGNIIRDNYYGIGLYNSTSNNINLNNITDNYYGIYLLNSNNTTISGNNVTDNWDGIHLYNSTSNNLSENTVKDNWIGIYFYMSNNNTITGNTVTDNGAGISYCDSTNNTQTGNNIINNWVTDISQVNSSEIVVATTIYTCGPAALATILKHMNITATEEEIANLADTDETGTTMYGLKQAAINKGFNSTAGYIITTDNLQTDYIVVLKINGNNHYNIIRNISNGIVYLTDPNLGNIEMTLSKFNELYTGYALVVSNGTIQVNGTLLNDTDMQNIKAMAYTVKYKKVWVPGHWYKTKTWVNTSHYIWKAYWAWIPGYYKRYGRHYYYIRGHYEKRWKKVWIKSGYWKTTWHYQKGHWEYKPYRVSTYTKVNTNKKSKYVTVNAAYVYNKTGGVECSYEWKGWNVVYKRLYYSKYIFGGCLGIYGAISNPAAGYYLVGVGGGAFGFEGLMTGLNEYSAHLNEIGS